MPRIKFDEKLLLDGYAQGLTMKDCAALMGFAHEESLHNYLATHPAVRRRMRYARAKIRLERIKKLFAEGGASARKVFAMTAPDNEYIEVDIRYRSQADAAQAGNAEATQAIGKFLGSGGHFCQHCEQPCLTEICPDCKRATYPSEGADDA